MITAIKADNVSAYKLLFEEASDILSGYERVQTYDSEKEYYYKDANTKEYIVFIFESEDEADKLVEFANALVEYKVMYTPIINPETGLPRGAVDGFAPELGITTLEEYFNWLPDLKRDVEGKPTKYTILPLDEPHFVINANTRAINIPADFKKNGIAVQGDDLAEVVYFEIDRYFDAMDLNNCEIYIQWETPRTADSTIIKSISDVYIRDIESQPGKLIFGWAISDAITVASGNLKFSVKFLQWDTNAEGKKTIAYSLNTLTAQVAIQQSIGIDLEKDTYIPDNANDRLLERIKESEVIGGLQAAVPYFLENIEDLADGYDIVPNHTDGTLKIYAVATADDTGAVSYVWKKRGLKLDNSSEEAELEIANTVTEMVPVEEKSGDYPVLKVNHNYYLANGENSYIPYSGGKTIEELKDAYPDTEKIPVFYEKKAMLEVSEAGIYTVEARNRIFNSISKARSNPAVFKCPEPVGIDNSKETVYGHIIDTDSAVLVPPYNKTPVGDMSFQWYKAPEKNIVSENDTLENFQEIEGATGNSFRALEEGLYKVEITRTRNRRSISEKSIEYRVTEPPQVPVIKDIVKHIFSASDLIDDKEMFTLELDESIKHDEYEVVWMFYLRGANPPEADIEITKQYITGLEAKFNPVSAEYDEVFAKYGIEDRDGRYYAIVRNKRNGIYSAPTDTPNKDEVEKYFSLDGYTPVDNA